MEIVFGLAVTFVLLIVGFVFGKFAERKHLKKLEKREWATGHIIKTQSKMFLAPIESSTPPTMLCAETVIASDYFKNFLAAFRKFFGGEMRSYHSLMSRARRETMAKLMEEAQRLGYNAVCNIRLEPVDVGGNVSRKGSPMVCVAGTATAYHSNIVVKPAALPPVKK